MSLPDNRKLSDYERNLQQMPDSAGKDSLAAAPDGIFAQAKPANFLAVFFV